MIEKFLAEPLFEGRTYEHHQFIMTINGEEFKGVFKDDEINWYQPQPVVENDYRIEVEKHVHGLLNEYLQ
jgi:hypothetical protein